MKKRDLKTISYKVLSVLVVFSLLAGMLSAFPTGASPVLNVSAAARENIYTEGVDPYVVFDAEYMQGDNRLVGANQCTYSFIKDSDGRTLLRLVSEPAYDNEGNIRAEDPYISFEVGGAYSADDYKYVTIVARGESDFIGNTRFGLFYKINAEGKKNYIADENSMHRAEKLIATEFSLVLGIPESEVADFIKNI